MVNPFSGMTPKDPQNPEVDSFEGMINEAFGTNVTSGDFKNASPSMFETSMTPKKPSDFMASTENSWINQAVGGGGVTNPFLKGDSGFISPACQSNNHSASSEDSAENHDEREKAAVSMEAASTMDMEMDASSADGAASTASMEPEEDDEEAEAREVTKLLSGGIMETQFGDLMSAVNRETPTPPMEDTGKLANFHFANLGRFVKKKIIVSRFGLIQETVNLLEICLYFLGLSA